MRKIAFDWHEKCTAAVLFASNQTLIEIPSFDKRQSQRFDTKHNQSIQLFFFFFPRRVQHFAGAVSDGVIEWFGV